VRLLSLDDVVVGVQTLQKLDGIGCLDDIVESLGVNNEGDLGDLLYAVTTGEDKSGDSGTGQSGGNGVSALVEVGASVPSSPDLGGGEHSSTSAHVSESSLSGSVGSTTADTGNTSNGSSSSPGLSRGLVTGLAGYSVWLAFVLVQVLEDVLDQIGSHRGGEDSGELDLTSGLASTSVYGS